jgi:hypothetical protein
MLPSRLLCGSFLRGAALRPALEVALRPGFAPAVTLAARKRLLCAPPKQSPPPADGDTAGSAAGAESAATEQPTSSLPAATVADGATGGGGLALQEHEGENLPPLAFEPGVAGAAQKGVSAIVIAFGAAAFAAISWGAYVALFPGATSTQSIYSEAFEKVQRDPNVTYALGTPLRAFAVNTGSARGRRNNVERWDVVEGGEELAIVRFGVAGPQGMGVAQVQVPAARRRGEFRYIIFENLQSRSVVHVLDERSKASEAAAAATSSPPPPVAPVPATTG